MAVLFLVFLLGYFPELLGWRCTVLAQTTGADMLVCRIMVYGVIFIDRINCGSG